MRWFDVDVFVFYLPLTKGRFGFFRKFERLLWKNRILIDDEQVEQDHGTKRTSQTLSHSEMLF